MLDLSDDLRNEVADRCRRTYPEEACGLLLGSVDGQNRVVSQVFAVRNVSRDQRHRTFELDPEGFLAGDCEARAERREIAGIYHSHPDKGAEPSASDLAGAQPGWSYLIVSVTAEGVTELRSWHLIQGEGGREFAEETIRCAGESP